MASNQDSLDVPEDGRRIAFGKLHLDAVRPLRSFEIYFAIPARSGAAAWTSGVPAIQRLLNHLARFSRSDDSRECYLNSIKRFCHITRLSPTKLIMLPNTQVEHLIQSYIDNLAKLNASRGYLNTLIKRLRTFFTVNGYRDLRINRYYQPTRYRKRPEYIPTKAEIYAMANAGGSTRNRALILGLWTSGVRVSTLCALNCGDIAEELAHDETYILLPIFPDMKMRVSAACKGMVPYYTFMSLETVRALKIYLTEREERYGQLRPADPLFHSDWHQWRQHERSHQRLGRRGVGRIVETSRSIVRTHRMAICHTTLPPQSI